MLGKVFVFSFTGNVSSLFTRRLFCTAMAQKKETFLIAGLGNIDMPQTRHSIGMALVERLATFLHMPLIKRKDCLGFVAEKELNGIHLVLLKPKQPMNINGASVRKTASHFHIPRSHVYIVHDDLDKAVGKLYIKEKGSAGGHNGAKSVIHSFKSDEILRLKIGIDRPTRIEEVGKYVLSSFTAKEQPVVDESIDQGILKLAQHIGQRLDIAPAQVFHEVSDEPANSTIEKNGRGSNEKG